MVRTVCEIFREQTDLRQSRTHARIKYLFMKFGWTPEQDAGDHRREAWYKFDPC